MSSKLLCLYTHRYSLAFVMTLLLVTASADNSSPSTNITAVLGDTTTFRCHIQKHGIPVTDDSGPHMNIMAGLGDTTTFRCPWDFRSPVKRLYIQRVKDSGERFINGFDLSRMLEVRPEYQNRTKVNKTDLSMEMTNVSVSDEGLYKCYIFYSKDDSPNLSKTISQIHLKVTANYSVPTMEEECSECEHGYDAAGKSCQLSCLSVGGYPQSTVSWTGLNLSLINVVHNESSEDPYSKTWTINQTITYNCDQPTNVCCAVGGAVSPVISIICVGCKKSLLKFCVTTD